MQGAAEATGNLLLGKRFTPRPIKANAQCKYELAGLRFFVACGCGAVAGGLSLIVFRDHFITSEVVKNLNVLVTPVLIGWLLSRVGTSKKAKGRPLYELETFWRGWGFAFTFATARLLFAH